jgi:hypothetical protein
LISPAALLILLRDPFAKADFDEFLVERARTIQNALEELMVDNIPDMPADLRKFDGQIEEAELGLRRLVCSVLSDDAGKVPSHVAQRIEERIERALAKNTAIDPEHYATLEGMLEYADLRELQDTIVNGALWSLFSGVFGTKEELIKRFDQLAEARNTIRHSRTLNEVARRDGEASIAWFQSVLARNAVVAS